MDNVIYSYIVIVVFMVLPCFIVGMGIRQFGKYDFICCGALTFGVMAYFMLSQLAWMVMQIIQRNLVDYSYIVFIGITIVMLIFLWLDHKKINIHLFQWLIIGIIIGLTIILFIYQRYEIVDVALGSSTQVPNDIAKFTNIFTTGTLNGAFETLETLCSGYYFGFAALFRAVEMVLPIEYPIESFINVAQILYFLVFLDLSFSIYLDMRNKHNRLGIAGVLLCLYLILNLVSLKFGFDGFLWIPIVLGFIGQTIRHFDQYPSKTNCGIIGLTILVLLSFGLEVFVVCSTAMVFWLLLEDQHFNNENSFAWIYCGITTLLCGLILVLVWIVSKDLLVLGLLIVLTIAMMMRPFKVLLIPRYILVFAISLVLIYLSFSYNTIPWIDLMGMRGEQLRLNIFDTNGSGWLIIFVIIVASIAALLGRNTLSYKINALLNIALALTPMAWGIMALMDLPCYGLVYIVLNPYSLIYLFHGLTTNYHLDPSRQGSFSVGIGLIILYSSIAMMLTNPYYGDFESANSALNEARIGNEEYALYAAINQDRSDLSGLNIISQAPFTTAFVPNIHLLYTWQQRLSFCQYCDVEAMDLHMPDMLTNIFAMRDYADNRLFIEPVDYSQSCPLLLETDIDYLIIDKSQTKNIDSVYMPLYERLEQCSQPLFDGDHYIVLKVIN